MHFNNNNIISQTDVFLSAVKSKVRHSPEAEHQSHRHLSAPPRGHQRRREHSQLKKLSYSLPSTPYTHSGAEQTGLVLLENTYNSDSFHDDVMGPDTLSSGDVIEDEAATSPRGSSTANVLRVGASQGGVTESQAAIVRKREEGTKNEQPHLAKPSVLPDGTAVVMALPSESYRNRGTIRSRGSSSGTYVRTPAADNARRRVSKQRLMEIPPFVQLESLHAGKVFVSIIKSNSSDTNKK